MDVRVEQQTGLAGEPEPTAVWFGRRRVVVQAVLDRWYGHERCWWKLQTSEGDYVLRQSGPTGEWELAAVVRT